MNIAGQRAAQRRMLDARGSVYAAFDSLLCGIDHVDAERYLEFPLSSLPEDQRGKVVGSVLGFAITAIEADRQQSFFRRVAARFIP